MTKFKDDNEAAERLRMEYSKLIEVLPQCAVEKLGKETLGDMQHRYACLTQLTRKHSGEFVAADQTRDYWRLVKAAPRLCQGQLE